MPAYSFYQKSLVRTVEVNHFHVHADSYAAAIARIRDFKDHDVDNHTHEEDVESGDFQSLYECSSKLDPDQNGGAATIETYNEADELVASNASGADKPHEP